MPSRALKVLIRPSASSITVHRLAIFIIAAGFQQRDLQAVAQAREGTAQIMGHIIGHFADAADEFLNAVQHPVQALGQGVEFVMLRVTGTRCDRSPAMIHPRSG